MTEPAATPTVPLGFGGVTASANDHIAHFYRGEAEMFEVLGPYIAEGLRRGEHCAAICSPAAADGLRRWLADANLDPAAAEREGRLVVHHGEASAQEMAELFERLHSETGAAGYPFLRLAGDGGWALARDTSTSEMLR